MWIYVHIHWYMFILDGPYRVVLVCVGFSLSVLFNISSYQFALLKIALHGLHWSMLVYVLC